MIRIGEWEREEDGMIKNENANEIEFFSELLKVCFCTVSAFAEWLKYIDELEIDKSKATKQKNQIKLCKNDSI